jgi:hypothetical protein
VARRPHTQRDPLRQWHRWFGLLLADHLAGTPFSVELEMDLSRKQQLLDVVVIRRHAGSLTRPMPDGLGDLVAPNLISFKSHHEPLDDWTLKELTGHYVAYRKQVSPRGELLSEDQFRLYAVCARTPRDLFATVPPEPVQAGAYTCRRGTDAIRIVVAGELPREERNALLHLFSAAPEQVEYGQEHHQVQSADMSSIVNQLFGEYWQEGLAMPYTMEDFRREYFRERLRELAPADRKLVVQEIVAHLSPEQLLAGLSAKQIEDVMQRLQKQAAATRKLKPKSSR